MRKIILAVVIVLLVAVPLLAQGVSWRLQVYAVGGDPINGTPFFTLTLPSNIVRCAKTQSMPTVPRTSPVNPITLWWTQPELPGYVCKADLSRQPTFLALPVGGPYPFSLVAANTNGDAMPTVGADPFTKRSLPLAVGTLIITKP